MVILKEPFNILWKNSEPFAEIEQLQGITYRAVSQRRTFQFTVGGQSFFIKIHYGTTLGEIFKNLLTLRLPIIDSQREWKAIHHLQEAGIGTMKGVAFGKKGCNPLTRKSFIITEDLNPAISLEDFCRSWQATPPLFRLKRALIKKLANMIRIMHESGLNHRDCYLCHFLLKSDKEISPENLSLSVIDLHRAQIRGKVPIRWRNKDLIGLYFSAMNIGLTRKDIMLFMTTYFQSSMREILLKESNLLSVANEKAEKIRVRTERKGL